MAQMQDFKEDLPLLVETGLIAIKQGDEDSARKLFQAVGILDPENTAYKMGFGLIAMHKMDLKNAEKYFQEILKKESTNYRAQAFLGFTYILSVVKETDPSKRAENLQKGAEIVNEVIEKADSPTTKKLAESLMEWVKELEEKATSALKPQTKATKR